MWLNLYKQKSNFASRARHLLVTSKVAGVLALLAILSCSAAPPPPPNTLVLGVENGPAILDPRYATDAISVSVCELIYGGLFKRDADMRLINNFADSVERPQAKTYVIKIKEGVRFHSGQKLTSADVRFTLESILDKKNASPKRSSFSMIESINIPDPLTIVITLKEAFAPFLGNLTLGIVPRNSGELTKNPVGAGPFKFVDYERGDKLRLSAFGGYFDAKVKLSGVTFRILPDETVRLLELKKGNIHLLQNPITPAVLPWLEKQKGIILQKKIGTNVSYIGFNMEDEILRKPEVRRAIAHAINRDAIIKHLLKGMAVKTSSLIAPANRYYAKNLESAEFNPQKAKKLLDEAGYPQPSEGKPRFTLTYKTSKNPTRKKIAEVFARQLEEVGIKVTIQSYEWGTFFADIKKGSFQMYSLTWVGIADPDIYHYIFHSQSFPPQGANRGRYVNSTLDGLLEKGRGETIFAERKKIYDEVQRIIAEDMPYIHLWVSVNIAVMSENVKGFEIYPDESLQSLARVTLEE